MNFMPRFLILLSVGLLLSGCWAVEKSITTIEFSRARGQGALRIQLSGIHCVDKGNPCEGAGLAKETADLKRFPTTLGRMLRAQRFSEVNASLKPVPVGPPYSAELVSKFESLTQFPFFETLNVTLPEVAESQGSPRTTRNDLVLEFTVTKGNLIVIGDSNALLFHSTEKDAEIMEFHPTGTLDAAKRTVTWENPPAQDNKTKFMVRLKGRSYKLD